VTCQRLIEEQVDACPLFAPPYEHARTVR
jgi:hypothetical protein